MRDSVLFATGFTRPCLGGNGMVLTELIATELPPLGTGEPHISRLCSYCQLKKMNAPATTAWNATEPRNGLPRDSRASRISSACSGMLTVGQLPDLPSDTEAIRFRAGQRP